jgi:hypothetical protein
MGPSSGWSFGPSVARVDVERYDARQPVVVLRVPVGAIERA